MTVSLPAAARTAQARNAAAIRARRVAIAAAMLERAIRRQETTVGAELLALAFADRFADACAADAWTPFFEWLENTCEKYRGVPEMTRLLSGAVAAIAAVLGGDGAGPQGADLAAVASRVAQIVDRPRAGRGTAANAELDEVDVTLDGLMSGLTTFDAATADHSRAVAMWCTRLGQKLGMTAAEIRFVTRAGLIHDIGKVTTPTEILNAPYRLDEREMAIMQQHAAAGAAIVARVPLLAPLTPVVRGHHERIDGRGYPDGRAGAEIPLAVRIVSVADSFNAMIGNRPYRAPLPPPVALEALRQCRGTQFDENVVAAMIEVVAPRRA